MPAAPLPLRAPEADVRQWEAECAGKDRFPSGAAAAAVLANVKRERGRAKLCWLTTYPCSFCGGWHLGNTRKV